MSKILIITRFSNPKDSFTPSSAGYEHLPNLLIKRELGDTIQIRLMGRKNYKYIRIPIRFVILKNRTINRSLTMIHCS